MKKIGDGQVVQGRLNPFKTLSDCGNYTKFMLNFRLQKRATTPTGGEIEI